MAVLALSTPLAAAVLRTEARKARIVSLWPSSLFSSLSLTLSSFSWSFAHVPCQPSFWLFLLPHRFPASVVSRPTAQPLCCGLGTERASLRSVVYGWRFEERTPLGGDEHHTQCWRQYTGQVWWHGLRVLQRRRLIGVACIRGANLRQLERQATVSRDPRAYGHVRKIELASESRSIGYLGSQSGIKSITFSSCRSNSPSKY